MDYEMDFEKSFDVDALVGGDMDFGDDALMLPDDAMFDDEEQDEDY